MLTEGSSYYSYLNSVTEERLSPSPSPGLVGVTLPLVLHTDGLAVFVTDSYTSEDRDTLRRLRFGEESSEPEPP